METEIKSFFRFYNELADKYPLTEIAYSTPGGRVRENYLKKLLLGRDGLTLDIGCFDGLFAKYIKDYVGIDIAVSCLGKFKKPRAWALAQIPPFRDGVFDRVLLFETLEHIRERDEVLGECLRLLKPEGELIVSVPYGNKPLQLVSTSTQGKLEQYGIPRQDFLHGTFHQKHLSELLIKNQFIVTKMTLLCRKDFITLRVIPKGHWPTLVAIAHPDREV